MESGPLLVLKPEAPQRGFKKVDPDRWEFANEGFVKGHKHLLKHIHRRKSQQHQRNLINTAPCMSNQMETVPYESVLPCEAIDTMKREKNCLTMEVIRLRRCQQEAEEQVKTLLDRLLIVEDRQHNMMAFIARALHNSPFMEQLVLENAKLEGLKSTKMRQFLPTSFHLSALTDESQLSGTLESSTITSSKPVPEPVEGDHGGDMLLEFLASDDEAKPAQLEALIQEMEHSTTTTDSNSLKMVETGLRAGSCTLGLPLDVASGSKLFDKVSEGSFQNTEVGLPFMVKEGDNRREKKRIRSLDCGDADFIWEQLMLGMAEVQSDVLKSLSIMGENDKEQLKSLMDA